MLLNRISHQSIVKIEADKEIKKERVVSKNRIGIERRQKSNKENVGRGGEGWTDPKERRRRKEKIIKRYDQAVVITMENNNRTNKTDNNDMKHARLAECVDNQEVISR